MHSAFLLISSSLDAAIQTLGDRADRWDRGGLWLESGAQADGPCSVAADLAAGRHRRPRRCMSRWRRQCVRGMVAQLRSLHGQRGDDTNATRLHPVMVADLDDAQQIDVGLGPGHSCAVVRSGKVRCWGVNFNSQLGDGTMTNQAAPVEVSILEDATQVSTGAYHTCALRRTGKVACWGGKHGRQERIQSPVPREVADLADATQIAAGGEHTCALRSGGTVVCWGMNGAGQLGDGTWNDHEWPIEVRGLREVTSISWASNHTCAVLRDRTVRCWGANEHGQLGGGTTTPSNVPVTVPGLTDVTALSTGHRTSCAVTGAAKVLCWGELDRGDETAPH